MKVKKSTSREVTFPGQIRAHFVALIKTVRLSPIGKLVDFLKHW